MAAHFLPEDHEGRGYGLAYLNPKLSAGPATHVLIIGVAAYQSADFPDLLSTATISARALADWFVNDMGPHYDNPQCPLGSVAVLLSETKDKAKAVFAGGPVPRATFDNAARAIEKWQDRIETHAGNQAILYVACHGESIWNRDAFILEDFGTELRKPTFGMCDINQLTDALELCRPSAKLLLFDCCRVPSNIRIPVGEFVGSKLVEGTDRGYDITQQWVLSATSKGRVALGLKDGPTFFNMALLDCLNGAAGHVASAGWPVRPGLLADQIGAIMQMYQLPGENQSPSGKLAKTFDITLSGERSSIPVYVAFHDPSNWDRSTIKVRIDNEDAPPIQAKDEILPVHRREVPELSVIEVSSKGMTARDKVRAPAAFISIGKPPAGATRETDLVGTKAPGTSELIIKFDTGFPASSAIAEIARLENGQPVGGPRPLALDFRAPHALPKEPGDYRIQIETPDGRRQIRDVTLTADTSLEVPFDAVKSSHEWLRAADSAGAIRPAGPGADPLNEAVTVDIVDGVSVTLEVRPASAGDLSLVFLTNGMDERFLRLNIEDRVSSRYYRRDSNARMRPHFVRVLTGGQRDEIAVVPSLGYGAPRDPWHWQPFLLIDHQASRGQPIVGMFVEDQLFGGLLAALGTRNFLVAGALLESGLLYDATAAIEQKLSNPLAAIAGALIAVAVSSKDKHEWDPWLRNLSRWFSLIPDVHIVLARRELLLARNANEADAAREGFRTAFELGVPVYSLSVDWLAQGLESSARKADVPMAEAARRLAGRVDPKRAFVVVRMR